MLPFSSLKAASPALAHPSRWHGVVTLSPEAELEGRPHLSMVGEGWQEVAASIDSWLDGVLDALEAAE